MKRKHMGIVLVALPLVGGLIFISNTIGILETLGLLFITGIVVFSIVTGMDLIFDNRGDKP